MKKFQHLVVAYDGTDDSREALELGIDMSKQLQSSLSVVNIQKETTFTEVTNSDRSGVFPPTSTPPVGGLNHYPVVPVPIEEPDTREREYSEKEAALRSEAQRILDDHNVDGEVKVAYGEPSDEIVNYAKNNDGDLIIIGSRDISGLKRLIFGSVSEKVSHSSTIPVLIAK
ncbi:universal stress protein [Metabacillus litoralis]|uniref:Universal stress protein n=1 Tax=Metabacillus litoralis TaxID=152268 RepID=A0A5C6W206_9BACI|nr:universal stress protein [Metabacillus litoralis]TXC89752.1 universal stress protein [Metabacillus litoralis]